MKIREIRAVGLRGATPEGGWSPDQKLRRNEALLGFTTWAAEACAFTSGREI